MSLLNNLPNYVIALATSSSVALILIIVLCVKISKYKWQLKFLSGSNLELSNEKQVLQAQALSYIQKIEQQSSKIDHLLEQLSYNEKVQVESFNSAKAALFDLGGELSKQLIELHKKENKEVRELSEKNIETVGAKFNGEFERIINLVGALSKNIEQSKDTVDLIKQSLLSPTGAGRLAEITLENILKSSGLRTRLDFSMQYSINNGENIKLRPDALIFLPAGNLMVIDAKASKFLLDDLDHTNLTKTMNGHLKSLSGRDYAENILINFQNKGEEFNNIITLMFLPTEHAVEKIIEADSGFLEKAWNANIFPVGPAGLMNMLSFAKFQISEYRQVENHKLILEEVRQLLQSVSILTDYSQKLGSNIQSLASNYDKFAASFNRNFLHKVKNIKKLGIASDKKGNLQTLERYQLISTKSDLIEIEPVEALAQLEDA